MCNCDEIRKSVTITKDFTANYAHIVPNAYFEHCRTCHGHMAKISVHICGNVNQQTGMLIDFKELKEIISPVIDLFDHSTILWEKDPNVEYFMKNFSRMLILNCIPTAENLSSIIFNEIHSCLGQRLNSWNCKVFKVDFWETSSAYASTTEYNYYTKITDRKFIV